jgi:predicted Zn-dependent protease with MMP-like domain
MTDAQRARFDDLLEDVLAHLPEGLHRLLEESPLIVEDEPDEATLRALGMDHDPHAPDELCGLHTGVMLTERSVNDPPDLPEQIQVFRRGVVATAGGWSAPDARLREEIRVTVLHEIGHHFGLEEDDLDRLGYA